MAIRLGQAHLTICQDRALKPDQSASPLANRNVAKLIMEYSIIQVQTNTILTIPTFKPISSLSQKIKKTNRQLAETNLTRAHTTTISISLSRVIPTIRWVPNMAASWTALATIRVQATTATLRLPFNPH